MSGNVNLKQAHTHKGDHAVYIFLSSSTGDDGDPLFSRPRDLDLIQSVPPVDLLSMKAPPRVLTLTEQPLDSLETEQTASSQNNPSQVVRVKLRLSFMCPFLFLCTVQIEFA